MSFFNSEHTRGVGLEGKSARLVFYHRRLLIWTVAIFFTIHGFLLNLLIRFAF